MSDKRFGLLSIMIVLVMTFPSLAFSHGWGGYEQGAKAHGMGGGIYWARR